MKPETKDKFKIGIIAFLCSALGVVASQSFIAGGYARSIETNTKDILSIETNFEAHKSYDDQTYLKKEVFNEFKMGEHKMLLDKINGMDTKIDRLLLRK